MNDAVDRREFLIQTALSATGLAAASIFPATRRAAAREVAGPPFRISLAEWSLHQALFAKKLDNLDFAKVAKEEFGIEAVEYVNQFFADKAKDKAYLGQMKQRAADLGVRSQLIMIDREGKLGDPDPKRRTQAVENHYKWVEAARFLGCHSIRVNAASQGPDEEQSKLAADGLRRLSEFAGRADLNVIVENHGGLSSNGKWLVGVIQRVNLSNCGTLPDFGNFGNYDRYQGVEEMMPLAKAVSAKSYDFDAEGNETKIDFLRMMKIVVAAGYHDHVGIEYEGKTLDEYSGIRATKKLLLRVRDALAR